MTVATVMSRVLLITLLFYTKSVFGQPPAINQESVVNAASHIPPSLPGGALAPGTRIVLQGFRFGRLPQVRLISGQYSADVRVLSSDARQIEALLPDNVPSGSAELTVANEDGLSKPFAIRTAPNSPGIYTENGAGWGPAKIGTSHGNRITILCTGWGHPRLIQVFVGGKRARLVSLQAQERDPGVERLEFEIPANAPPGCHVPLLLRLADGMVSNAVTIPVGICEPSRQDPFAGVPPNEASALVLLARLHVRSASSVAADLTEDFGAGVFAPAQTVEKLLNVYRLLPPEGTCTAYTGRYAGDLASTLLPPLSGPLMQEGLEAGSELSVSGPNGTRGVEEHKRPGIYGRIIGFSRFMTTTSRPPFLSPGNYSVSWRGGPEVPASKIQLTMPAPFSWINASKITVVNRNANLTLKWRPRATAQRMAIVAVNVDPNTTALATCFCLPARRMTTFSIPAMMLANLPKTPEHDKPAIPMSLLALVPLDELQRFPTPGLEIRALVTAADARVVVYR